MSNTNMLEKAARSLSGLLEGSANEANKVCLMLFFGEPEFPLELLTEEK